MKKMKRLVAVLLAGVMALTMLTACGSPTCEQKTSIENDVIDYYIAGNSNLPHATFVEITDSDVITCFNTLAKQAATKIAKDPDAYNSGNALSEEWTSLFNQQEETLGAYYSVPILLGAPKSYGEPSAEEVTKGFYLRLNTVIKQLLDDKNPSGANLDVGIHAQVYQMESSNNNYWILFALGSATPSADT